MESDWETDSEKSEEAEPPPAKKLKLKTRARKGKSKVARQRIGGAARYNTKFNKAWTKKYECVQPVKNNPHSFLCTVCNKSISCKHQGETDIKRHIVSTAHASLAKQVEGQQKLMFQSSRSPIASKVGCTFHRPFKLPITLIMLPVLHLFTCTVFYSDQAC